MVLAALALPLIGNYFASSPNGILFLASNTSAFLLDPGGAYNAGTAAPDDSYHRTVLADGVTFEWGRRGAAWIGRLTSPGPAEVGFMLKQTYPGVSTKYKVSESGVLGESGETRWNLQWSSPPLRIWPDSFVLRVGRNEEARLVAGFGALPSLEVDRELDRARAAYEKRRPKAEGDWGDFLGAIADNLNNSRLYASDDKRVAISVSRGWAHSANEAPYFCWDSFFNAALSCLDDPKTARETIRAILSWQTPEGLVPNFGHWSFAGGRSSPDRSQPPVGSMCVWKVHQRWPDKAFLREVYPKLLKWHRWWPTARDGRHDGLLEWGSSAAGRQGALWETGWDDTVHFDGAEMSGITLDAYAVDLSSLWAMDAGHLARIARAIGKISDTEELEAERAKTLQSINERLWNAQLGIYCSRLWSGGFLTRLTPMNFYPLIAGAPDEQQARSTLKVMTDPKRFWGDWILPTVAYDDPVWPQQDYWRGKVWAPVNFLVSQGLYRFAPPEVIDRFADRSVTLFMRNWEAKGMCGENYLSKDGTQSSDPHYTWGALLCLIGLESVCGIEPDGRIRLNGNCGKTLVLRNVPMFGKLYNVRTEPHRSEILRRGKLVMSAEGRVVVASLPGA